MNQPTHIVFVRHGETVGDSVIRLYGATDIALSDAGRRQMQRVAAALAAERFDAVVASPLVRSQESARMCGAACGAPVQVVEGLREIDFGAWEGLTLDEAQARDPETWARWRSEGDTFRFPGGDQRAAFRERIGRTTREVLLSTPGRVLCVLHKGVIKVALSTVLGLSADEAHRLPIHLGSIHRLSRGAGGWQLDSQNETAHLGGEHIPE